MHLSSISYLDEASGVRVNSCKFGVVAPKELLGFYIIQYGTNLRSE